MIRKLLILALFPLLIQGCAPYREGDVALRGGDYRQAIAVYQKHLGDHPADDPVRERLVRSLVLNCDYGQALEQYGAMIEPTPAASLFAGLARMALWDFDQAQELWSSAELGQAEFLKTEFDRMAALAAYVAVASTPGKALGDEQVAMVNNQRTHLLNAQGKQVTVEQLNGMALEVMTKAQDRPQTLAVIEFLGCALNTATVEQETANRLSAAGMQQEGGESGGGGSGAGGGG